MRILIVSFLHPAVAAGGSQQVAYEMFRAALESGHDTWLLSGVPTSHLESFAKPGAAIVPLAGTERQYLYFPEAFDPRIFSTGDWRTNDYLGRFVSRLSPDVIHFHHYQWVGLEAIRVARIAAPRAVLGLTFHDMWAICMAEGLMVTRTTGSLCERAGSVRCSECFPELRPEFFWLRERRLKYLMEQCDFFAFPSNFIKDRYKDWGLPPEKCVVIANGQQEIANPTQRRGHSEAYNRFGFFGQLLDHKGAHLILEALLILAKNNGSSQNGIVIEFNGANKSWASKKYLGKLDRLLSELAAYSSLVEVIDRGPYPHSALAKRMADCDWVIVPSTWWEIFGLVLSEAWMCGRPVLVSDIGGLGERVNHGVNGLHFPVGDATALASLISKVTENRELWHKLNASIGAPLTAVQMLNSYLVEWRARMGASPTVALPDGLDQSGRTM
jgi:glycosyltransferase involved in cell wall biosynthesis